MRSLWLGLSLLLLAGCASMGSKNNIKEGVYYGTVGGAEAGQAQNSFSVKVPTSLQDKLVVKQQQDGGVNYVSFASKGFDFSIYRAMVGRRDPVPFEAYKQNFPQVLALAEKGYGQPLQKIYSTEMAFQGHPAMYAVYVQTIPGTFQLPQMRNTAEETLTHAVYMIYYEKDLVVLWGQYSANSFSGAMHAKEREALVHRTWKPMNDFVDSFRLTTGP